MKQYSVSVVRADESYGSAVITYSEAPTVTVEITAISSSNSKWRIRGRASLGDSTVYIDKQGLGTYTFDSDDNKSYIFQIQNWNGDWVNTTNAYGEAQENSIFNVNFESGGSSGGDSGGGSGGGSDSGDDDNSGENSDSGGSVYPTSGTQNGVTATFTISGSTVTVTVLSTNLYWRINGTNSGGDYGTYYISENRSSSRSFTAEDGHAYAFQVCSSGGTWSDGLTFYVNINSGGSGSGDGDGSGGSSGGSTNDGLKTYTMTALGVTAEVTYTSGPEVTITIKSWSGYNSIPYWRVKGRASQGDTNTYLSQTNASSASFDSYDGYNDGGKEYTFQVCRNGTWGNDSGESSVFLVDFSLDGDGSGGNITNSYILHFNEGEGTNLTVTRTSSSYGAIGVMYENGNIYYDDIWANDHFEIIVEAKEGYQLNELVIDGLQYANGVYTFGGSGDASITTSATLVTSVRIFNKNTSTWNTYALNIYNGSSWNRYRPYIYDGSSWNLYG